MAQKNTLFCSKPFTWFEVTGWNEPKGDVYMCCSAWLNIPIGNLTRQSVEEIWNGAKAREIRQSILDGSFKFCNHSRCPSLQTITGPVERIEEVKDEDLKIVIEKGLTVLPHGPREINCSYDRSCNLSCPSCRTEIIIESGNKKQILNIQKKIHTEALKDAHLLYITGSGDPFGGPFYREWLQTMRRKDMPNLRQIHIHTNAQLWTPKIWNTLREDIRQLVKTTEISIDAASAPTYSVNRRGGSFERLIENLTFISALREHGPLKSVTIGMVVQENNFLEMPDFIRLGKRFHFDTVYFSQLVNWGTYSDEEFRSRAVHLPSHPKHSEFIELLQNEIFHDSVAHLGNLTNITHT